MTEPGFKIIRVRDQVTYAVTVPDTEAHKELMLGIGQLLDHYGHTELALRIYSEIGDTVHTIQARQTVRNKPTPAYKRKRS